MIFQIIVCILLAFAKGELEYCSVPPELDIVCGELDPNNERLLPKNATELKATCSFLIDYIECLHIYDLACAGRSIFSGLSPPWNYQKIKGFLDDACDPTSNLHNLLLRDLPCIRGRVMESDMICGRTNRYAMQAYQNYLRRDSTRGAKQKALRMKCLELVSTAACLLEDIEQECGFLAYEAANNALTSTQLLPYKCDLMIFLELRGVQRYLDIDYNTKEKLSELFVVHLD